MTLSTLDFIANSLFTLKRASIVSGKRGEPIAVATDKRCTSIEPSTRETVERAGLSSPLKLFQFYTDYSGVRIGDYIESGSSTYQVRGLAEYEWTLSETFNVVVIEDVDAPADTPMS